MSLDVLPTMPMDDSVNSVVRDVVLPRKVRNYSAIRVLGSNRQNLICTQSCPVVLFSMPVTTFRNHVLDVHACRARKQMMWITAWRVVTSVQNPFSSWYGTNKHPISHAMGTSARKFPIPIFVPSSLPLPTQSQRQPRRNSAQKPISNRHYGSIRSPRSSVARVVRIAQPMAVVPTPTPFNSASLHKPSVEDVMTWQ